MALLLRSSLGPCFFVPPVDLGTVLRLLEFFWFFSLNNAFVAFFFFLLSLVLEGCIPMTFKSTFSIILSSSCCLTLSLFVDFLMPLEDLDPSFLWTPPPSKLSLAPSRRVPFHRGTHSALLAIRGPPVPLCSFHDPRWCNIQGVLPLRNLSVSIFPPFIIPNCEAIETPLRFCRGYFRSNK